MHPAHRGRDRILVVRNNAQSFLWPKKSVVKKNRRTWGGVERLWGEKKDSGEEQDSLEGGHLAHPVYRRRDVVLLVLLIRGFGCHVCGRS